MNNKVQTPTATASSPAIAEVIVNLMGECGETVQTASKLLQHGPGSRHPIGGKTNKAALESELGNILGCIEILVAAGALNPEVVYAGRDEKLARFSHWSHGELAVRAE
jgi:hypothetical protein